MGHSKMLVQNIPEIRKKLQLEKQAITNMYKNKKLIKQPHLTPLGYL